ncbi:MAG TPA: hypothetical protein PKY82_23755 [Pyrinomonadaceae bacterium]|nr:hypothetical protein [Pyrinomonadaceae bacterium]
MSKTTYLLLENQLNSEKPDQTNPVNIALQKIKDVVKTDNDLSVSSVFEVEKVKPNPCSYIFKVTTEITVIIPK